MYQTAHQNDGFNALRLCCSKLNPVCLCYDSKPQGTMSDSTSQHSSRTAKSGKFTSLSRAIKHSGIHLEVLSSQNRKSFEYFLCFHRTSGISPKDLGFKADNHLHDAPLLADDLNFDLTFVTRNFIGSCVIRCAF